MSDDEFKGLIATQGRELYRPMPWREDTRPYYVLVSELMLQQTQVGRVIPKFEVFIRQFPTIDSLARASLSEVLIAWQGLGYNRRAKYLHEAARMIGSTFAGNFPKTDSELLQLPGVGKNTAGAIAAYAYNRPSLYIETNIRTVYIHHFFEGDAQVSDGAIMERLVATLDYRNPRAFYWALMDYGSSLKARGVHNVSRSAGYTKQSPLEGSVRQMRGQIVAQLSSKTYTNAQLRQKVAADERYDIALNGLLRDGLVTVIKGRIHLTK